MIVALVLGFAGWPASAEGADPSLRWSTITTPHFYVHYYRNVRHDLAKVAQAVAVRAEQAHRALSPLLQHSPSERTHVVVSDDVEGANGSAQIIPRNIVRVYVTGADAHSSMNDYDDWLYQLIVHEYTHILHIDTVHGIPRLLNMLLGKSWAPNQLQPPWIIEGLATFEESERTSGGRVRGAIFDMLLRTSVLEGQALSIDQISSNTRIYPRGVVRYLYGCRFIKYIADRFGEGKLARISHIYGGRPLPYAINRVAKEVLGHTLIELYADFLAHLKRSYALKVAQIKRRGITPSERLTHHGENMGGLRFSPDGRELIYTVDDGFNKRHHLVRDPRTGKELQRLRDYSDAGMTLTPDGRALVHAQRANWRTFYQYTDLFVRQRRGDKKSRRLTKGIRAHDPDVSPDGRLVVFTANDLGDNDLVVVPFAGGKPRVIYEGKRGDKLSGPRFGPRGRRVVFSRWREGGYRDIYLADVATGALRRLTADRAQDLDPVFSADGQRVYFASDRTGIFNIYCHDLSSGELWQVTNLIGGAFYPAVSADERTLFFAGYAAKGYDLHRMKIARERFLPALPYVNRRPPAPRIDRRDKPFPVARYQPWRTILPERWMGAIGSDAYGTTLGLELDGSDVVGRHRYTLRADISLEQGHPSYVLRYAYDRFWPTLRLDTARTEGPRGGLRIDGAQRSYIEENYGVGAGVSLPVLRIPDHSLSVSVGYRFNWYRDSEGKSEVLVEPGEVSPDLPPTGKLSGATIGISYRHRVERYAYSISNERGRSLSLNLRVNSEVIGSDFDSVQLTWAWAEYLPMPWLERHVLALRLAGGIGRGDTRRRGPFFIGGFPEQNVIQAVIDIAPLGGAYLRGYAPGSFFGEQFHLLNVEYRMPVLDFERGISSLPVFFNHLHLALFVDVGNAFYDDLRFEDFNVGVGAELLLEWQLFYIQGFTLRLGYARGLMDKGSNELHMLIGNRF